MNRLMIAALPAALLIASTALADGCVVAPWSYEIWEVGQIAFLDWDAETSTETLHILPQLQTEVKDFAWIVPVPALPELEESDGQAFRQLEWLTEPEYRSRDEGWSCEETSYDIMSPTDDSGGVSIIDTELVGIYDTMILAADDAGALSDSLTVWGFLHEDNEDDLADLLDAYVQDDWYFVTLKVDTASFDGYDDYYYDYWYWDGGLEPISLAFSVEAPVYPMRISALSAGDDTSVILYVQADERLDFDGAETEYANRLTARELAAIRSNYPELGAWLEEGLWLTKLARRYSPADMDEDVYLVEASRQAEYRPITYSGVPLTALLLLTVGGGAWWRGRRARRVRERA